MIPEIILFVIIWLVMFGISFYVERDKGWLHNVVGATIFSIILTLAIAALTYWRG